MLREETAEGRNGWYEARERLGQVAGYLADLARTRCGVDQHVEGRSPVIGLGVAISLMTTSMNSLAGNIPTDLLAALVESGTWLPSQDWPTHGRSRKPVSGSRHLPVAVAPPPLRA